MLTCSLRWGLRLLTRKNIKTFQTWPTIGHNFLRRSSVCFWVALDKLFTKCPNSSFTRRGTRYFMPHVAFSKLKHANESAGSWEPCRAKMRSKTRGLPSARCTFETSRTLQHFARIAAGKAKPDWGADCRMDSLLQTARTSCQSKRRASGTGPNPHSCIF